MPLADSIQSLIHTVSNVEANQSLKVSLASTFILIAHPRGRIEGIGCLIILLMGVHRIPTVQKEAIRPIKSAPTTILPRPYPHNPPYLPYITLTLRGNLARPINLTRIFWSVGGKRSTRTNPCRHGENVQTPHRQ